MDDETTSSQNEQPKDEFSLLNDLLRIVYLSAKREVVLPAQYLISIRDHMEVCDHLLKDDLDKTLLLCTYVAWSKCRLNWEFNTPKGEENIAIPDIKLKTKIIKISNSTALAKRQNGNFNLSEDDKRFLRSLRIAHKPKDDPNNDIK